MFQFPIQWFIVNDGMKILMIAKGLYSVMGVPTYPGYGEVKAAPPTMTNATLALPSIFWTLYHLQEYLPATRLFIT